MKTVIHVNRAIIKANKKDGKRRQVLTIKDWKQNRKGQCAQIVDRKGNVVAQVVYRPCTPLKCGAQCWVETELKVVVKRRSDDAGRPRKPGRL